MKYLPAMLLALGVVVVMAGGNRARVGGSIVLVIGVFLVLAALFVIVVDRTI